ncbi:Eco57I restriction-modification methylase domain-containing protein [Sphaerospermopsis kisseleviana CS-549]|uniref:site-specific DNA-methyltransferase (adenine-specific) n=1 Tax=Sphaerospermopsis kisseleviana CS-549 TaxID=3021783 RepID=A0ABT4ZQT7_9CYAN|nr:Eco57I restriction-modification methylase domain-containing protein [Sphaerospermopsis kisseleviana]MDB9441770.1 Eco57I restriction-modification methylase domain-containing protein [Sphaerospermopsis kisseleviana CS-549]BAZ80640.1 type II site-specific deoxyribonuclease [Sphaerospermopsis kisseleviana NIES-73]
MISHITDLTDITGVNLSAKLNLIQRSELGQFLTPATVAKFMAGQFNNLSGHISLLDPGAGVGTLTAAFVEQLLLNSHQVESCFLTAYEIESTFISSLEKCLIECCRALENKGIKADYSVKQESFINSLTANNLPLFNNASQNFTHAIINPPYKKINSQSIERKQLSKLGIETVNLYSAFVWLTMLQLAEHGEIVAITPRSFCNGAYFRPFRQAFLQKMSLQKIHVFDSRDLVFAEDNIIQENIIFHAIKTEYQDNYIQISINSEIELDQVSEIRLVPYHQIIEKDNPENFIHIITNYLEDTLKVQMDKFPSTLEELGLEISTGPVVDFRLKSALRNFLNDQTVPLIYPESIKPGKVLFPPQNPKKSIAIVHTQETQKWLIPQGCYVLTKRFSAKEEKRRVVAAVSYPIDYPVLGIENHINYYHAQGKGININLAKGLTAFLNSTLFEQYFRLFSGNTQVNATDLRKVKYPCKDDLIQLGKQINESGFDQDKLDDIVNKNLSIMSETINAIAASKRIQEAMNILKEIAAPKEQQNERSALCLLALADIRPETSWNQATAPKRRITEMMDWFRDFYGKQYAPNTRETVRRQTMHQFVQMGLVVENPDQPNRPINSPKWCYQLQPIALSLIKSYNSELWEESRRNYAIANIKTKVFKNSNHYLIY